MARDTTSGRSVRALGEFDFDQLAEFKAVGFRALATRISRHLGISVVWDLGLMGSYRR
jgi:hypothetical protein